MGRKDFGLSPRYNDDGLRIVNDDSRPGNQSAWLDRVELVDSRLLASAICEVDLLLLTNQLKWPDRTGYAI